MRLDYLVRKAEVSADQGVVPRLNTVEQEDVSRFATEAHDGIGADMLAVVGIEAPAAPQSPVSPTSPFGWIVQA
jgi:hypothetical protein